MLDLAEVGIEQARHLVESAGRAVGAAIAQLVNVLDPEAVVIGGGLGMVQGLYRRSIEEAMRSYTWSELHRSLPLLAAGLGTEAGWIGEALGCEALGRNPEGGP